MIPRLDIWGAEGYNLYGYVNSNGGEMDHGKKIRIVTQGGTFYLDVDGRPDGAESILPKFLAQSVQPGSGDLGEFMLDDCGFRLTSTPTGIIRITEKL